MIFTMIKSSIVAKLAFDFLKQTEQTHSNQQKRKQTHVIVPNDVLVQLHSLFGNVLNLAAELLDNCKIIQYQTPDQCRRIYKIGSNIERYTVYNNINFCQCQTFQSQVLEDRTSLTCKHVLAIKLNQITNRVKVRVETVTDSQFVEFLNEQLNCVNESHKDLEVS